MNITYYAAMSLDGYIADSTGGVDWLDEVNIDHSGSSYDAFYETVDGLIMGRETYAFILNYGSWPYDDKPTWIIASHDVATLSGCHRQPASTIEDALQEATSLGLDHLWLVGGGQLAAGLMTQGVLTHLQVTVMPVVLGQGISFLSTLPEHVYLTQEAIRDGSGCIEVTYQVGKGPMGT
ncbi:MAG: dihydrofolate reductase family protein [Pseudomonadota bacterium]